MNKKLLSKMAYGRYLGLSETSIRNAVKAGKIDSGWDPVKRKIVVAKADIEFGNQFKLRTFDLLKKNSLNPASIIKLASAGEWCKKNLYKFELYNSLTTKLSVFESQLRKFSGRFKNETFTISDHESITMNEINSAIAIYTTDRFIQILNENFNNISEKQLQDLLNESGPASFVDVMFEIYSAILLGSYNDLTQGKEKVAKIAEGSPKTIIDTFRTLVEQNRNCHQC